ncbi:MAG: hypothetical protein AAGF36_01540 [Pseudomonadota bacterium]
MSTGSNSTAPTQDASWTTLSNAHVDPSLRDQNPIYERSGSASRTFEPQVDPLKSVEWAAQNMSESERRRDAENQLSREAFMASRRDSEMVKRQRALPELKPSPRLSHPVLAMGFDREWSNEAHAARDAQERELLGEKRHLQSLQSQAQRLEGKRHAACSKQDLAPLSKELFKLRRQTEAAQDRERQRSREERDR